MSLSLRLTIAATALTLTTAIDAQVALPPPATPTAGAATAAPSAPASPAAAPSYAQAMATGRAVQHAVMFGDLPSLVAAVDPQAAATATDIPSRVSQGVAAVATSLGGERRMISEQIVSYNGRLEYRRISEYELVPVPAVFRVILGAPGTWRSFSISTDENTPPGDPVNP